MRSTSWSNLVKTKRPDLIILTDDVYGTFVHGFRSLMGALPRTRSASTRTRNTLAAPAGGLASSRCIRTTSSTRRSPSIRRNQLRRWTSATARSRSSRARSSSSTGSLPTAATSRLNHTAGLSLPQQVMMTMFSLFEMMDEGKEYQKACMEIVNRRAWRCREPRAAHHARTRPTTPITACSTSSSGSQEHRRRSARVREGEHSSARHRVPPCGGPRHRAAERWRLRRAELVACACPSPTWTMRRMTTSVAACGRSRGAIAKRTRLTRPRRRHIRESGTEGIPRARMTLAAAIEILGSPFRGA